LREGARTSSGIMTRRTGKVRCVDRMHLEKSRDFKVRFS